MKAIGLLIFILFEIIVLLMGIVFGQSLAISIAVGLFVAVGAVLYVTSDSFLDHWERNRDNPD